MAYGNYAPFYRPWSFNTIQNAPMTNIVDNANQFAQPYQPPMPNPQMQTSIQTTPMISNDMIWVLNENEATSYPVAPNNNVVLWDKNTPTIYVKSVNAQGVPSMRVLDFVERTETASKQPATHECACGNKYATKEQISALEGKIDDLTAKYEELAHPIAEKPKVTGKKIKDGEE